MIENSSLKHKYDREQFYETLDGEDEILPNNEKKVIMGDLEMAEYVLI